MDILYIDASVSADSRTQKLAYYFLDGLNRDDYNIKELKLTEECIPPLNIDTLTKRTHLCEIRNYEDSIFDYAKDYAAADMIVVAAPYWDLSFPAILKTYIEAINVVGITFKYNDNCKPEGLCKAKRLVYITTAGGKIVSDEYGYGYIKELAKNLHGIKDTDYIKAEELDIDGADIEDILSKSEKKIDKLIEDITK